MPVLLVLVLVPVLVLVLVQVLVLVRRINRRANSHTRRPHKLHTLPLLPLLNHFVHQGSGLLVHSVSEQRRTQSMTMPTMMTAIPMIMATVKSKTTVLLQSVPGQSSGL